MSDDLKRQLAIVIPFYRGGDDLLECLESLRAAGDVGTAQIICVDDASQDDTADRVRERYPAVLVVQRKENGGFAKAVNTGLQAVEPSRRFIAILNSDTAVDPQWSAHALRALNDEPRVAAVAPKIVLYDDPSKLDSAGQGYTLSGWAYRRGHGKPASDFSTREEIFGPTGCALFIRREAIDGPMLFREDLVCYYEDVELSMRLLRAGWKSLYVPESIVRHKVSMSYSRLPAHKAFHVSRNLELIYWQHMPRKLRWRATPLHIGLIAAQALQKTLQGQLTAYLRGKVAALKMLRGGVNRHTSGDDAVAKWVN